MNQIILLVLGAIKSERRISSSSMWVSGTSTFEFRRMPWTTAQNYPGLDLCLRLRRLNLKHFKAAFQSIWLRSFNEGKAVTCTIFWYILTLWGNVEYLGHWFSRSWVKSSKRLKKHMMPLNLGRLSFHPLCYYKSWQVIFEVGTWSQLLLSVAQMQISAQLAVAVLRLRMPTICHLNLKW